MPADPSIPALLVDEARIRSTFGELENMELKLDDDPLVYGPKRLNGKVSQTRALLTRCERIYLQVSLDLALYKRSHQSEQLDFDLQKQDLFSNDPEVRSGRNVADREALATMKLRGQRERIMQFEIAIQDLELIMSVVKAKRADLRDIQSRLKDQINLCREEIGLGDKWGSRAHPGTAAPDLKAAPKTDPEALAALQDLVQESGGDEVGEVRADPAQWLLAEDSEEAPAEADPLDAEADALLSRLSATLGDDSYQPPPAAPKVEVKPEQPKVEVAEVEVAEVEPPAVVVSRPAESEIEVDDEEDADPLANMPDEEPPPEEEPAKADIFAAPTDAAAPQVTGPVPVTSDEEADSFFAKLDTKKPAKGKAVPSSVADDDLDSLLDMFGE